MCIHHQVHTRALETIARLPALPSSAGVRHARCQLPDSPRLGAIFVKGAHSGGVESEEDVLLRACASVRC